MDNLPIMLTIAGAVATATWIIGSKLSSIESAITAVGGRVAVEAMRNDGQDTQLARHDADIIEIKKGRRLRR